MSKFYIFSNTENILFLICFGITSCIVQRQALDSSAPITKNIKSGTDKNSNFIRANEWMVETYNNAEVLLNLPIRKQG
jgi:hypothetical protein